jgi:hypothetical protein
MARKRNAGLHIAAPIPDFAALHPDYALMRFVADKTSRVRLLRFLKVRYSGVRPAHGDNARRL